MEPGPPQREDVPPRKLRAVGAVWGMAAGVVLGLVAVVCVAVGAISGQQAVAIVTPGFVLIIGGLIVASLPDPQTGRRVGFQAGLSAGLLLKRRRAAFHRSRDRQLPHSSEPSNNEAELGDGGLAVGDAAWVKASGRVQKLIEWRPPWPVFERPQGIDDLGRFGRAVGDCRDGHPPR